MCMYIIGLDVELETNVIVEEGESKRPYIDPGHIDSIDDNVINAAGEPGLSNTNAIMRYPSRRLTMADLISKLGAFLFTDFNQLPAKTQPNRIAIVCMRSPIYFCFVTD